MLKGILTQGIAHEGRKEIRKIRGLHKYGWVVSAILLALMTEGLRAYRKKK